MILATSLAHSPPRGAPARCTAASSASTLPGAAAASSCRAASRETGGAPRPRRRIAGRPLRAEWSPRRHEEAPPLHPRPRPLPRRLVPRARAGRAPGGDRTSGPFAEARGPRLCRRPPDEAPPRLPAVLRRRAEAAPRRGARREERALRAPEHRDRPGPRRARDGRPAARHRDRREPAGSSRARTGRSAPSTAPTRSSSTRRPGPTSTVPARGTCASRRSATGCSSGTPGRASSPSRARTAGPSSWPASVASTRSTGGTRRRAGSSRRPPTTSARRAAPSCRSVVSRFNQTRAGGQLPRRLGLAWRKMADPSCGPAPATPARPPRPRLRDAAVPDPGERPRLGQGPVPRLERLLQRHLLQPVHRRARHGPRARDARVEGPRARATGMRPTSSASRSRARTRSPTPTAPSRRRTSTSSAGSTSSSAASSRRSTAASPTGRSSSPSPPTTASRRSPSARRGSTRPSPGGRVLTGNGAVTNFEERLNRYLCEELCLPLDARPIFGNEGFDLKYNLPALPADADRRRAVRRGRPARDGGRRRPRPPRRDRAALPRGVPDGPPRVAAGELGPERPATSASR